MSDEKEQLSSEEEAREASKQQEGSQHIRESDVTREDRLDEGAVQEREESELAD
ncbi:MAG TPA: hypothetical protein VF192_01005 [Longimicrobiales bacterium]